MLKYLTSGLGVCLVALTGLSYATTYAPVRKTCPIGGEKFQSYEMMSNSYFGQRPDGKPYSPTPVGRMTECPKNGFIVFDETFSKAELALLTPLVASAEYQAMRGAETQHYRAWWLLSRSGRHDAYLEASFLLTASWEADDEPDRKARYQAAFIVAATAIQRDEPEGERWFSLNLRAANALRELGRFDEAAVRLEALDHELPRGGDELAGARFWIDGLRVLVRNRNKASEPLSLVPQRVAVELCLEGEVDPSEQARCSDPKMAEAIAQMKAAREDAQTAASEAAAAASEAAQDAAEAAREAAKKKPR